MSSESESAANRVNSAPDLEMLVGMHVTREVPEVFWADSHGYFHFATESEALAALKDPYYQQFLPNMDWSQTVIRKVNVYRSWCSDPTALLHLIEIASERHGALAIAKEHGRWWAAFGVARKKHARTAAVAVCLAALEAAGIAVDINHDHVDAELNRKLEGEGEAAESRPGPDISN